jgi:phosphoribosylamine--glycine ligase
VVEFNCRFGDPETQAVLPLLETPLEEVMLACIERRLDALELAWKPGAAACVVVSAEGYPDSYPKGMEIVGVEEAAATGALVFQAGTRRKGDRIVADGGRVLGVTGLGETFEAAIANAYAALDKICFDNMYFRRDIGYRVMGPK